MALGTTVAALSVGNRGTIFITDDGYTVRFYVACSDPLTNCDYRWHGSVGGVYVGTNDGRSPAYHRLNKGFGESLLWAGPVTNSLQVSFYQTATGTSGLGGASGSVVANISRATTPPAPTMGAPDNITTTSMRTYFVWNGDGGSGIIEWEAQIASNAAFTTGLQSQTHPFSGQLTFNGLTKTTTYYLRARGRNALGWGAWSNVVSAVTASTIPDTPPAPTVNSVLNQSVTYTCTNPPYLGASPYTRTVQLLAANGTTLISEQVEPVFPATFTGLTRGTTYRLRQKIRNVVGDSTWSSLTTAVTAYDAPSALAGYNVFDVASTSAWTTPGTLADNGGTNPSDIRVQINTTANPTGAATITMGYFGNVPMTGLTPGATYYYRLAAYNGSPGTGWGPYGAWVSFTLKTNVPTAPLNLMATAITNTSALLTWSAPADLKGATIITYELRVARNKGMGLGLRTFTLAPSDLNQALGALLPGTTYYMMIWTTSSNGIGSTTSILSFTTAGSGTGPKPIKKKIDGVWRQGIKWKKIAGVWRPLTMWKRINGTWRNQ